LISLISLLFLLYDSASSNASCDETALRQSGMQSPSPPSAAYAGTASTRKNCGLVILVVGGRFSFVYLGFLKQTRKIPTPALEHFLGAGAQVCEVEIVFLFYYLLLPFRLQLSRQRLPFFSEDTTSAWTCSCYFFDVSFFPYHFRHSHIREPGSHRRRRRRRHYEPRRLHEITRDLVRTTQTALRMGCSGHDHRQLRARAK